MLWLLAILAVPLGAHSLSNLIWLIWWILRGGSRVVIPWTTEGIPKRSSLLQRRRTRDGSHLVLQKLGYCALVFWKIPLDSHWETRLLDFVTGSSGAIGAAVDFSHMFGGESWLITSYAITIRRWNMDGPHFAPVSANHQPSPAWARVDVSSHVSVQQLLSDIQEPIYRTEVRHRGMDPFGYFLGLTSSNRVTCSGLIGGAILRQNDSPLAKALRQALRERWSYGEITPADLARAAAILGLIPESETQPIVTVPIMPFGRGVLAQTRRIPRH